MVADLGLPIEVNGLPIVREASGLALSSRNNFLSNEGRVKALTLTQTINEVINKLKNESLTAALTYTQSLTSGDKAWDYLEILEAYELKIPTNTTKNFVVAGAYYVENTRLIDNQLYLD